MSTAAEPLTARAVLYLRVSTREQAERGGEAEGFSIPAQREAGLRKAQALGAYVASEFIDAGESARSADRPELQRMLEYLRTNKDVQYVIVHKVDRLARSRSDDVAINLTIQQSGATLVSCTENIDETPSGMLMHGIMSSIAEFYSRNLANEVIKGTQQKVKAGGTVSRAPIGYRNVRREVDGREVRTVELDRERADLIRWAFTAYATGDYSLRTLADALADKGLTQRATARTPSRPLPANKLHQVLNNRYYISIVTWRGMEYPGKHEPLVDLGTFEDVQQIMAAHKLSGERSYRHKHYLTGSVFCGRCGTGLQYTVNVGRRGDRYAYFVCRGRHSGGTGCDLPYLRADDVAAAVVRRWSSERLSAERAEAIRRGLQDDLELHQSI